ncbi:hypothetical protein BX600DRAFT_517926 [Xylariales sp. PMI_506]|nr:hypothetical protein BX600DRAFT_517926 [Xylariales sp. PMI_506]
MKTRGLALFFLGILYPTSLAFNIPNHLPDGMYTAVLDSNGEILGDIVPLNGTVSEKRALAKRQLFPDPLEIGCTGISMNSDDEHTAWTSLGEWCDDGGHTGYAAVSIAWAQYVNAVWYVCAYDSSQGCSSAELTEAGNDFFDECGTTAESAYVWISAWAKTYGRTNLGESACNINLPTIGTE